MKKPDSPKERNLLKGAMRRIFSRSELRKKALERTRIAHTDANRPRVTKWSFCSDCGVIEPSYLMEVDHREPLIPLDKQLEDMLWDELVDRLWCDLDNLAPICKPCHKEKSKAENKMRRDNKKGRRK